ncbi:NAD-dependent epimerase/dehydratase family protein [Gorillibacterium sp. sgz5001074]|uniref:NAD-dependent epimerase/dehydratase family protein n=1 Tax=Gorillibacterium sp. sgz5001074 TaxID=3446695 RepID=UPI003F676984
MKLLILGGTVFLGYAIAEEAVARGHDVTIFTRGRSGSGAPAGVRALIGDRDGGLQALKQGEWDAVIDTSGYVPRVVRAGAELLADRIGHYTFISSASVYRDLSKPGTSEEDAVLELEDEATEDVAAHYGALKARCEAVLDERLPGRVLTVRPGLIVGPRDPTDRFTYWPSRIERGGQVLAPGPESAPVQIIDVRDLAAWIVSMTEARRTGVFNAAGEQGRVTMQALLEQCRSALNPSATLTWADEEFLAGRGVGAWKELPLWLPARGDTAAFTGLMQVNVDRALRTGLVFRPLEATIRDTAAWDAARPSDTVRRAGLMPEREAELLQAWLDAGSGE